MSESPVLAVPQSFAPATSYQVRDELADYLSRDLLGPWAGQTEQFAYGARGPRDRYLVGMLGPKHNPRSVIEAASDMPDTEPGSDADGEDGELRETFSVQNAGRIWASSMGLSFGVPLDVDALAVTVGWGHYDKVLRTVEEPATTGRKAGGAGKGGGRTDGRRAVWVRHPVEHTLEVRLDGERSTRIPLANPGPPLTPEDATPDHATPGNDPATRDRSRDTGPADEPADPPTVDPDDAGVFLAVDVRECVGPDGQRRRTVELALINAQQEAVSNPDAAWLFQPGIRVTALDGAAEVFLPTDDPLTSIVDDPTDAEERHLRLLYRHHLTFAGGRNVAVHPDVHPGADPAVDPPARRAWRLTTTWLPTFDVPATVAPTLADTPHLAGLELAMDELATLEPDALAAALAPLASGYAAWLDERAADVAALP
ncbi:MAG TPA: hypothetical protein VNV66_13730, partial [Pilimelia sp.]|nr:hypothetical protein [Pilimelia sp.]